MARNRNTSPLFLLIAAITVFAALYFAKAILLPIALAILLTFLFTPLCNRIERLGVPRIPTTILVVGMSFALIVALGWVVGNQLVGLTADLNTYRDNVIAKIRAIRPTESSTVGEVTKAIEDVRKELAGGDSKEKAKKKSNDDKESSTKGIEKSESSRKQSPASSDAPQEPAVTPSDRDLYDVVPILGDFRDLAKKGSKSDEGGTESEDASAKDVEVHLVESSDSILSQVAAWLGPLGETVATLGLIIVLVFFILLDRENQRDRLIQLFGASNLHTTTEALQDAAVRVGRYLQMMFLMNAGYGIAVTLGLWLIGVPSAAMWGVLGFALRFLPYLGPWLAAAFPLLVSIAVSDSWTPPLMVASMYAVYELFLNNVAEPLLYGNSVGVSTVGVFISAIFWTWIWGPVGLIVALPITVCVVVFARYVPELKFITVLLADRPPLTPAQRAYQRLLASDYNEPLRQARQFLKENSLQSYYDGVLIPALTLAERDRHAGALNDRQETFVIEASEDLVEYLGEKGAASASQEQTEEVPSVEIEAVAQPTAHVLCVPLRDEADEITARMLAQLLEAEGHRVETATSDSLTSEVVDRVASAEAQIVVISVLPPIRPRESRLLWTRLRQRYPKLPIVVGFWTGGGDVEPLAEPEHDAASKVVTNLADATTAVRHLAAQLQLAKAV